MKRTKTEDEYIWVQELQTRMARLEKEQQAQSKAEKRALEGAALDALPKMRPRAGHGDMRLGRD